MNTSINHVTIPHCYTSPPTEMVLFFSTPRQTVLESDQFATVCVSKSNPSMLFVSASIRGVRGTADSSMGKEDGSGEKEEE